MKEVLVLRTDGGDEEIDARHLDDGEECDEDEPWREDLLYHGLAVQRSPYPGDSVLALFLFDLFAAWLGAQKVGYF